MDPSAAVRLIGEDHSHKPCGHSTMTVTPPAQAGGSFHGGTADGVEMLTFVHGRMLGPTWKPVLRPNNWLRMNDFPCLARPLTETTATALSQHRQPFGCDASTKRCPPQDDVALAHGGWGPLEAASADPRWEGGRGRGKHHSVSPGVLIFRRTSSASAPISKRLESALKLISCTGAPAS